MRWAFVGSYGQETITAPEIDLRDRIDRIAREIYKDVINVLRLATTIWYATFNKWPRASI